MPVLLLKSWLSVLLLVSALIAMYTMFELFGKKEKRFSPAGLKQVHQINGYLFLILFLVIGYLCLDFLVRTKIELNSRITFHTVLALAVLLLLLVKIAYIRLYRLFYPQVRIFGLIIAIFSLGLVLLSGGYYLLVTEWGAAPEPHSHEAAGPDHAEPAGEAGPAVPTDEESIRQGQALYDEKCIFCHDPRSTQARLGPGHRDILQRKTLPVSGRPATPANIVRQLREPYRAMPSFNNLTEEQIEDLLAYLKTL